METQFVTPAESREDPDLLITKFRELCNPQTNIIVERHKFKTRNQREGETTEAYITDLKKLANQCEYGNLRNDLIRDRIVCGIKNENTRRQMLKQADLTIERAIQLCQIDELTDERLKEMTAKAEIDELKQERHKCKRCGQHHGYGKCPAFGSTCNKCSDRNHWAIMCNNPRTSYIMQYQQHQRNPESRRATLQKYPSGTKPKRKNKRVYELVEEDIEEEPNGETKYYVDTIETINAPIKDEAHVQLKICGKTVSMKIDTGARINVMKLDVLESMQRNDIRIQYQNAVLIKAYGGETFSTLGTVEVECEHNAEFHKITFHIIPRSRPGTTILGLNDCLKLGLVQLSKEVYQVTTEPKEFQEYQDLFSDTAIGKLPLTYKMKVDKEVAPVVKASRRLPIAYMDDVKKELHRMEGLGVIKRAEEPTDWVTCMVATRKKNGDIRVCLDPRDLNWALKRPHHPMKTREEVISYMPNAKFFTILDAKAGFWQIPLDEDSIKYTTFNSPFGRFQFIRLPFGLNSSAEVFQRTMEQLFSGYPCSIIVDDILVSGSTIQEHDENLQKVLKRCKEVNLKLNKQKYKVRVQEVSYVGHILTKDGVKPDASKIQAITAMPPPEDKKGIQRLLGMTNYLSKFIPNYSEKTTLLRELLHKGVEFCWLQQHQEAFEALKSELIKPTILQYYDVKKPVVLTYDASQSGLGAVMIQEEKPVAYASRALTETEIRYSQIEKNYW